MGNIIAEILGLMDEPRHDERLLAELAEQGVWREHRALVGAATCGRESATDPNESWTRTVCRFDTPCGRPAALAVFFEPITGSATDVVDRADGVHWTCPEMLTDGMTRRVAERSLTEEAP